MALSLRARLVVGLVALVLGGLLVADGATYVTLRQVLIGRVDQQLDAAKFIAMHDLGNSFYRPPPRPQDHGGPPGFATYEAQVDGDGRPTQPPIAPSGTSNVPELQPPMSAYPANEPQTVRGTGGSEWRLLVLPQDENRYVVVAIPLSEVDFTLNQVVLLEAIIGGAVLVALVVVALLIVRLGLWPLERMGQTAEAIAGGDLSRRVSPATPRTEIGRLGLALNG